MGPVQAPWKRFVNLTVNHRAQATKQGLVGAGVDEECAQAPAEAARRGRRPCIIPSLQEAEARKHRGQSSDAPGARSRRSWRWPGGRRLAPVAGRRPWPSCGGTVLSRHNVGSRVRWRRRRRWACTGTGPADCSFLPAIEQAPPATGLELPTARAPLGMYRYRACIFLPAIEQAPPATGLELPTAGAPPPPPRGPAINDSSSSFCGF
jgi:hypothetical protein